MTFGLAFMNSAKELQSEFDLLRRICNSVGLHRRALKYWHCVLVKVASKDSVWCRIDFVCSVGVQVVNALQTRSRLNWVFVIDCPINDLHFIVVTLLLVRMTCNTGGIQKDRREQMPSSSETVVWEQIPNQSFVPSKRTWHWTCHTRRISGEEGGRRNDYKI